MRHRAKIGAFAVALLLAVGTCNATEFCGGDPGRIPDRPCEEDLKNAQAVAAKYEWQWKSISGVASISVFHSRSVTQIVVEVQPSSLGNSVEAVLPSEVEGYPVRISLDASNDSEAFSAGGTNLASNHSRYGSISPCKPDADGDSETSASEIDTRAYDEVISDPDTESWLDLPGVLSIGPQKCGDCDCVPLQVAVTVQARMLESVRAQLPTTKFGVPIVIVVGATGFGGFIR